MGESMGSSDGERKLLMKLISRAFQAERGVFRILPAVNVKNGVALNRVVFVERFSLISPIKF